MIQVLLILLFGSIYLFDWQGSEGVLDLPPGEVLAWLLAPLAAMWGVFQALCVRWGRLIDRKGSYSAVRMADTTMLALRLLAGAWWGFCLFAFGSLATVRGLVGDFIIVDELATMLPVLLFFAATWWSLYPLELRIREALLLRELNNAEGTPVHPPLTRGQYVSSCLRHQAMLFLAPLTMMMAWHETLAMHVGEWIVREWRGQAEWLLPVVTYAGIIAILITSPAVIRRVWDTVPIGDGPLREQMRAMCRQYRIRVRGPLLWRTHGAMVNGAILGIFWPLRYMLLSDALLERLNADQVEAVMAHEVAHVRRRHLIWLAVCVISAVLVLALVLGTIVEGFHIRVLSPTTLSVIMGLMGIAGAGTVFGLVSRRFEWQADAFAVQHLTRTREHEAAAVTAGAVGVMSSALQSVADLNGIDPERFTWRHGSVRERQRRLATLIDRPVDALPIDRQVKWIKIAAVVGIIASFVPFLLGGAS
ncbi:MAG TPA: M48 family metalloprotease [Phycisphaerales bacterium]|nr:M48 family metalloprotease [Phycisphaerales bacterium]